MPRMKHSSLVCSKTSRCFWNLLLIQSYFNVLIRAKILLYHDHIKALLITHDTPPVAVDNTVKKLKVNEQSLKKAWEASQRSTKEDWVEWIRRFSVELLRESPSPALRSCLSLAQEYPPLVRELFNAGFVSFSFL